MVELTLTAELRGCIITSIKDVYNMFITLTNAAEANQGKKITLNTANIVSIFEGTKTNSVDDEGMVTDTRCVTYLFVPPHGTWEVEETHDEIVALLCSAQRGTLQD